MWVPLGHVDFSDAADLYMPIVELGATVGAAVGVGHPSLKGSEVIG